MSLVRRADQEPDRTEIQRRLFKDGLRLSNLWYGHRHTVMWMQSALPPQFEGQSYESSGWCYVEASLSSVLKPTALRLDLGKHTLWTKTYGDMLRGCISDRAPPVRIASIRSRRRLCAASSQPLRV